MRAIAQAVSTARPRPRLACIEWIEPLMPTANWMPELVEMAGAENVEWRTWDDLAAADPDVILVMPVSYTHLDVYKRQRLGPPTSATPRFPPRPSPPIPASSWP